MGDRFMRNADMEHDDSHTETLWAPAVHTCGDHQRPRELPTIFVIAMIGLAMFLGIYLLTHLPLNPF